MILGFIFIDIAEIFITKFIVLCKKYLQQFAYCFCAAFPMPLLAVQKTQSQMSHHGLSYLSYQLLEFFYFGKCTFILKK